jgi:hypothetical protein
VQGADQNEEKIRGVVRTILILVGWVQTRKITASFKLLEERDGSTISSAALKKNLSSISTTPGLLPGRRSAGGSCHGMLPSYYVPRLTMSSAGLCLV